MKFLITGGLGFLGSNLSNRVLINNQDLFIIDNFSRKGCVANLEWLKTQGKFHLIQEDIRNKVKIEKIVKTVQPDVILHVAGQVAVTSSLDNPRNDFEINALGTFNIIEAIKNFSPESALIFSSTNKVYGDLAYLKYSENSTRYIPDDFPSGFNEDLNLDFKTPYACSKGVADQYVLDFGRNFDLKTLVFRHSTIYGPRQYP
ncbi:MAG: GDP-mannose 4,6-dehydratase, partial [Promethearchaeota archaeon]